MTERHEHPEPLSADEHEEHAKAHDERAAREEGQIETARDRPDVTCVDAGAQFESGGERSNLMSPCWTRTEQNTAYLRRAEREREAARDHRKWAQILRDMEEQSCMGLSDIEKKVSPFQHHPDIIAVDEHKEGGRLMGAKVTFRKIPGLGKEFLQRSIKCHQARAMKLGYAAEFMPQCPLSLPKTATSINETDETVEVVLRSEDEIVATQIYGRALFAVSSKDKAP